MREDAPLRVRSAICDFASSAVPGPMAATRTYPTPGAAIRLVTSGDASVSRVSSTTWGSVVLPRSTVRLTFEPGAPRRARMPSNTDISRVG